MFPLTTFPFLGDVTCFLTAALGDRLAGPAEDYLDLFGEDAVLEIPSGQTSISERVEGKAAIGATTEKLRGTVSLEAMTLEALHDGGDAVVLEYRETVLAVRSGVRGERRYIAVVNRREVHIALLREYSNPALARGTFAAGAS